MKMELFLGGVGQDLTNVGVENPHSKLWFKAIITANNETCIKQTPGPLFGKQ